MQTFDLNVVFTLRNTPGHVERGFLLFKEKHPDLHQWLIDHDYAWDLDVELSDMEYDTGVAVYRVSLVMTEANGIAHYMLRWG